MNAYSLKTSLVAISFVILAVFGVIGFFSCGRGGFCQSELEAGLNGISIIVAVPAFFIFILLLFLPVRWFGTIEND